MIFPMDYRQRLLKQQKSRQYKAMLDEQIRQNHVYSQQVKSNKRTTRIRTEPSQYYINQRSNTRQLPHQSTFLPSISTTNVIDHQYKYMPSFNYSRNNRSYDSQKQRKSKIMNDESDGELQKCLQQCDQLIHGINKNFVHLNNHFGRNSQRRNAQGKNQRNHNFSEFQISNQRPYSSFKDNNPKPKSKSRFSESYSFEDDIGRNQMMNYNLLKARQKQILHISMPSADSLGNSGRKDKHSSVNKSGEKTIRNNMYGMQNMNTPTKKKGRGGFDTINSDDINEFTHGMDLNSSKKNNMSGSLVLDKMNKNGLSKKQVQKLQAHMQMKKKDSNIIEHLRKAKTRGTILFKKIQMFRKQKQTFQQDGQQKSKSQTIQRVQTPKITN